MKTKRFYSYLLAAFCCLCAVFALTSCHPDDEEDDNNGNDHGSKTKIEYIEFKEPCLIKGATKDDVMAWMKTNMPEYETDTDYGDIMLMYHHKDNYLGIIGYNFNNNGLFQASTSGPFQVEKIFDFLDKKYGERKEDVTTVTNGVKSELYTYPCNNSSIGGITVMHQYGLYTLTNTYYEKVSVGYVFY